MSKILWQQGELTGAYRLVDNNSKLVWELLTEFDALDKPNWRAVEPWVVHEAARAIVERLSSDISTGKLKPGKPAKGVK